MNELKEFAVTPESEKWEQAVSRQSDIYMRASDKRNPFVRDYTRILHSSAFRRLKHKTQVFFSPQSDHICTRIEHILHVESIADVIADSLGLNTDLTKAIAIGHDLGHPPFGHKGEKVIQELFEKYVGEGFWHERNGVFIADFMELLEDDERNKKTLNLTYAVRDGIISHCGESHQRSVKPRDEVIDLIRDYQKPNQFRPYTYEACVVKMADTISYIGRDIEDARSLDILDSARLDRLSQILESYTNQKLNNPNIINCLITDICENSDPENGISFSERISEMLALLKEFNYNYIYRDKRVVRADKYFSLVINEIFDLLCECYDGDNTYDRLEKIL